MALGTKRKASNILSKQPLDLPPATVHAFAGTSAPEGWAMCDGSEVSRSDYAALFAAIGTTYGVGDGSTTFNLPDMRGEFLRGLDNMGTAAGARGKDTDGTARTVGQAQTDTTAPNGLSSNGAGGHVHDVGISMNSAVAGNLCDAYGSISGVTTGHTVSTSSSSSNRYARTNTISDHSHTITSSDTETRPANMAINYIIKL